VWLNKAVLWPVCRKTINVRPFMDVALPPLSVLVAPELVQQTLDQVGALGVAKADTAPVGPVSGANRK
jgi:hypothetical protein